MVTARPTTQIVGLEQPVYVEAVEAWCDPPVGWKLKPPEGDGRYRQQVWVSASRQTAYGVTRINLPWPVGPDLILWGYLGELRRREGEATVLCKRTDPDLPGERAVVEGKKYRIRINLIMRGWKAWAIFAGTLRDKPIDENELRLAETAREHTRILPVAVESAAR